MTREEIIRMAREAGWTEYSLKLEVERKRLELFAKLVEAYVRGEIFKPDWDNYRQGLIDGATAEREACADLIAEIGSNKLAGAIRARGQQ